MADESLQLPANQNLDYHIITLFQRLESMRKDSHVNRIGGRLSASLKAKYNMQAEVRSLEFWRSIIAECMASFLYVFIVCGAAAGAGVGASVSSVLLATALSSGFVVTTLTQCFSHISGAHINPAVTFGMVVIGAISPLRAAMYITAHCGGGIAGAALLYGVTVPGYQGNLQAAIAHTSNLAPWERFGVEMILTFIVVLSYFMSTDSYKSYFGVSSLSIGAAYGACSFVSMPYLNPARSLGPSFVLNRWENHWVYWLGPMVGGFISGIIYKYVFNPKRAFKFNKDLENDSACISDDDTNSDLDLDKLNMPQPKFHGSSYRSPTGTMQQQSSYCQNLYTTELGSKTEPLEPLYGGTRSMYCKSPPPTRANLNRSQSVYTKSNTAINREFLPRGGPLVPAQSLYPLRVNAQTQNSHLQNQNVQNQLQQRSESIYGIRSSIRHEQRPMPPQQQQQCENATTSFQPVYGTRSNPSPGNDLCKFERDVPSRDDQKMYAGRSGSMGRPDSMYGMTNKRPGQAIQCASDDSSYGSYPPSSSTPNTQTASRTPNCEQIVSPNYGQNQPSNSGPMRTDMRTDMRSDMRSDRKPSMGSGMEQRYGQVPMQSKPQMHNGPSNGAPITHQYNMPPMSRP